MKRIGVGAGVLAAILVSAGSTLASTLSATLISDFQSELGCLSDFSATCPMTALAAPGMDDVWRRTLSLPAGNWSYKVATDSTVFPAGPNLPLDLGVARDVRFYFDEATGYATDNVTSVIATLAGSFQSALGCGSDFDPACLRTWLTDPDDDGILSFATDLIPVGTHSVVVAHDESFGEVYGPGGALNSGQNISFDITQPGMTRFFYDTATHILTIDTVNAPTPVPLPSAALLLVSCVLGLCTLRRGSSIRQARTSSSPLQA